MDKVREALVESLRWHEHDDMPNAKHETFGEMIWACHDALSTPPAKALVDALRKVEQDEFGYRHIDVAVNNAHEGQTVRVRVTAEEERVDQ